MNPETVLYNAAELGTRYKRGLLSYAEFQAECWQLAHEYAFYTHTDKQWTQRQESWNINPAAELDFWNEMFKEIYSQAIA